MKAAKSNIIHLENTEKTVLSETTWTWFLLRWIGYGLLILALLDYLAALIPLRLTNAAWEFQTFGAFVERVPVPLLALVMIFAGKELKRTRWEKLALKALCWITLLLGVAYFLMVPLGVVNTIRLERQASQKITAQAEQQIRQIQQIQTSISNAQTSTQVEQLLKQAGANQLLSVPLPLSELKQRTTTAIAEDTQRIKAQAQALQAQERSQLLKSSVKWNLGALISGCLFLIIWRATHRWIKLI